MNIQGIRSMLRKIGWGMLYIGIFALTLLPIFNVLKMINYGENNLSNDYLSIIAVVAKALDGQLGIGEFIVASWIRDHFSPFWLLETIINARYFHWNTYFEMYFGVLLMLFRLLLIWDIFSRWQKGLLRFLILPVLSFFVFSATQATAYTWGGTAVPFGLLLFFGTLGIWALIRLEGKLLGLVMMVASGIICSWSWGAGVTIWPVYMLAILLSKYRKIQSIFIWLAGAIISAVPYAYFIFTLRSTALGTGVNFLNLKTAISLLGASLTEVKFENENPIFWAAGLFGIVTLGMLVFLWSKRLNNVLLKNSMPSLLVILWGLFGTWQISMGRTDMAPWYTSIAMNFWLGLLGFLWVLLFHNPPNVGIKFKYLQQIPKRDEMKLLVQIKNVGNGQEQLRGIVWIMVCNVFSILALIVIFALYFSYNILTPAQPFYLPSRTPSSAACLRSFETDPTYCEGLIFQWGVGNDQEITKLAGPLAKHQLSVFSPDQVRTLQGDFVFKDVKPLSSNVSWWTGLDGEQSVWSDYRHLDLMLPVPDSISWPVDLSDNIENASLQTAIGLHAPYASKSNARVIFVVTVIPEGGSKKEVYREILPADARGWQKVQIDLKDYLGKKIIVQLSALGKAGMGAMFQYPSIFIHQTEPPQPALYQPENVGSPVDFQNLSKQDFMLNTGDPNIWQAENMIQDAAESDVWQVKPGAMFQVKKPINVCLANYSEILLDVRQIGNAGPSYLTLQLWMNTGYQEIYIPLLKDGIMHVYSYPLKLLDLQSNSLLQDIHILSSGTENSKIQFEGVKLIALGYPVGACGK